METLKALLSNRTEVTAIVGVIGAISAKLGLGLSEDMTLAILGIVAFVIGAQGAANHGVAAAQITANTPSAPPVAVVNAPVAAVEQPKGFVRLGLMVVIAVVVSSVLLFGCSGSTRLKTLDATLAAMDSAEIGLVSLDQQAQQDIIDKCDVAAGKAACDAKLAAYRAKRAEAVKALVLAYTVLSNAFKLDDDASLANAIAAAVAVQAQLKGLGL